MINIDNLKISTKVGVVIGTLALASAAISGMGY